MGDDPVDDGAELELHRVRADGAEEVRVGHLEGLEEGLRGGRLIGLVVQVRHLPPPQHVVHQHVIGELIPRLGRARPRQRGPPQAQGDPDGALEQHQLALAADRAHLPPEHHDLSVRLHHVAWQLHKMDRNAEALEYLEEAAAIRVKDRDPEHVRLAAQEELIGMTL